MQATTKSGLDTMQADAQLAELGTIVTITHLGLLLKKAQEQFGFNLKDIKVTPEEFAEKIQALGIPKDLATQLAMEMSSVLD